MDPIFTEPLPLHVDAVTRTAAPPVPDANLHLLEDLPGAGQRANNETRLGMDAGLDANDLTVTGWSILFASDEKPEVLEKLQPLIDLRRSQVNTDEIFRVFKDDAGVRPSETIDEWIGRLGPKPPALNQHVDPWNGLPYYVLIVGKPDRISFEFQNMLRMEWAVGRLAFDDVEDYGRYAQAVVAYESPRFTPAQRRSAAVWITRNEADPATNMLSEVLCPAFLDPQRPLCDRSAHFPIDAFTSNSPKAAGKQQLIDILRGDLPSGVPALIFTGSHGANYPMTDPATQRRLQGSLITQEWSSRQDLGETNSFSAEDIPTDAKLHGAIAVMYACFSAGCPTYNNYFYNADGSKKQIAPSSMIGALPQALLSRGAQAVIGHIDMAFPYSFMDPASGTQQADVLGKPLAAIMRGIRVGWAADSLTDRWTKMNSQFGELQNASASDDAALPTALNPSLIRTYKFARDDARNYIVLGDPAVCLRKDKSK
jgi:hypothetical protein